MEDGHGLPFVGACDGQLLVEAMQVLERWTAQAGAVGQPTPMGIPNLAPWQNFLDQNISIEAPSGETVLTLTGLTDRVGFSSAHVYKIYLGFYFILFFTAYHL